MKKRKRKEREREREREKGTNHVDYIKKHSNKKPRA
jgi:hypothetical protein